MSDPVVRLHLLRVRPGRAGSVIDEIHEHVNPERSKLYRLLGDYDLLLVTAVGVDKVHVLGTGWIEGIVGVREIPCFTWRREPDPLKILEEISSWPLASLSFVQLHPAAYIDHGLGIEKALAQRLQSAEKAHVFGLYGIPEMAILRPWRELGDFQEAASILEHHAAGVGRLYRLEHPLVFRTLTLVGLARVDQLDQDEMAGAKPHDDCTVLLHLTSSFRFHDHLQQVALQIFGHEDDEDSSKVKFYSSLGLHDFTLSLDVHTPADLDRLLGQIVRYREETSGRLLATSSSLQFQQSPEIEPPRHPYLDGFNTLQVPLIDLDDDEVELIDEELDATGQRVIRTLFNFNDLLANPAMAPAVLDMVPGISYLAQRARFRSHNLRRLKSADRPRRLRIERREAHRELSDILLPIHAAVDQRTIAAQAAVSPVESHSRYLVGGIARVLLAAETIPLCLLRHADIRYWWGYVISGARHPHFYHEHNVVDIPPDALWLPEYWFVLIHESMHALVHANPKNRFGLPEALRESVSARPFLTLPDELRTFASFRVLEYTLKESFVDLLTFNCGPSWDPELYFRGVWSYLISSHAALASEELFNSLFLRNTYVYLSTCPELADISEEDLEVGATFERLTSRLPSLVEEMLADYRRWDPQLEEIAVAAQERGLTNPEEIKKLAAGLHILPLARRTRIFDRETSTERQTYFETDLEQLMQAVLEDGDDLELQAEIQHPELLVWKLQEWEQRANSRSIDWAWLRAAAIRMLTNEYWLNRRHTLGRAELVEESTS